MFQFVIASASEAIQRREETGFVALLPATTRNCEGNTNVLCRWIYRGGAEEKPCGLPPDGEEGRQGLARAWRAGLPQMGGRGRQGRKAHSFPRSVKLKPGETVVFSWITYKSRAQLARVNARVMADKRPTGLID